MMSLLMKYLVKLKVFGEVAFETRLNIQGRPTEYALLNERQTLLPSIMSSLSPSLNLIRLYGAKPANQ